MDINRAKSRLCLRLEKFFITLESLLIGGFLGFCFSLTDDSVWVDYIGAILAMFIFLIVLKSKRNIIKEELKK